MATKHPPSNPQNPKPQRKRRRILYALLALLFLLFLIALIPFVFTTSLVRYGIAQSGYNRFNPSITSATLSWRGGLHVRGLTLCDLTPHPGNPLVTADDVRVHFHWSDLWHHVIPAIDINHATIYARTADDTSLTILRLAQPATSAPSTTMSSPSLPWRVGRIALTSQVVVEQLDPKTPTTLPLQALLVFDPGSRTDFALTGTLGNSTSTAPSLDVAATLKSSPTGDRILTVTKLNATRLQFALPKSSALFPDGPMQLTCDRATYTGSLTLGQTRRLQGELSCSGLSAIQHATKPLSAINLTLHSAVDIPLDADHWIDGSLQNLQITADRITAANHTVDQILIRGDLDHQTLSLPTIQCRYLGADIAASTMLTSKGRGDLAASLQATLKTDLVLAPDNPDHALTIHRNAHLDFTGNTTNNHTNLTIQNLSLTGLSAHADFDFIRTHAKSLLPLANKTDVDAGIDEISAGTPASPLTYNLATQHLTGPVKINNIRYTTQGKPNTIVACDQVFIAATVDLPLTTPLAGTITNGTFKIATLDYGNNHIADLHTTFALANNTISTRTTHFSFDNGLFDGQLNYHADAATVTDTHFSITHIDQGQLMRNTAPGKLDGEGTLSGNITINSFINGNLDGSIDLHGDGDGRLKIGDIPALTDHIKQLNLDYADVIIAQLRNYPYSEGALRLQAPKGAVILHLDYHRKPLLPGDAGYNQEITFAGQKLKANQAVQIKDFQIALPGQSLPNILRLATGAENWIKQTQTQE